MDILGLVITSVAAGVVYAAVSRTEWPEYAKYVFAGATVAVGLYYFYGV